MLLRSNHCRHTVTCLFVYCRPPGFSTMSPGISGSLTDPAIVGLLRDQYSLSETGTLRQTVQKSVCNKKASGSSGGINLPIESGTIGLNFSSTTAAEACLNSTDFISDQYA